MKVYCLLVVPRVRLSVKNRTLHVGDSIEASCRGFGYPHPNMLLSMPNGSVYNSTLPGKLKWNGTIGESAEEGGFYSCSATNEAGKREDNVTIYGCTLCRQSVRPSNKSALLC